MSVVIDLPLGPSANRLHRNGSGKNKRVRTNAYRDWLKAAGWTLKLQRPGVAPDPCDILLEVGIPSNADADNRLKAVQDLLVKHQVIKDDSSVHVRQATARAVPGLEGCRVTITPASEGFA